MRLNFTLLLTLLLLLFTIPITSQSKNLVGKIVDKETQKPIPNVEVFFSGTTIGTITDLNGEFILKAPQLPCHLVVMHVSYELSVLNITVSGQHFIELTKETTHIDGVEVSAKNLRKKNLRLFYRYFLMYANPNQIKVLNDSVLNFKRDDYNLHVSCTAPLLIENSYLGYRIKVIIDDFHICKKVQDTGKQVQLNSGKGIGVFKMKGYYYFSVFEPSGKQKQYERNRRSHYFGSMRHFLKSLYDDELITNGYELKSPNDTISNPIVLLNSKADSKQYHLASNKTHVYYLHDPRNEPVNTETKENHYRTVLSKLFSLNLPFEVRPNGTSPNVTFETIGYLGQRSPANALPDNYVPNESTIEKL